jgi:hypothetical protein
MIIDLVKRGRFCSETKKVSSYDDMCRLWLLSSDIVLAVDG